MVADLHLYMHPIKYYGAELESKISQALPVSVVKEQKHLAALVVARFVLNDFRIK